MAAARIAAMLMALVAVAVGAIVVVGMVTGVDLEFEGGGTADAGVRDAQLALGALALLLLAGVVATARGFSTGRSPAQVPLFVVALVVALIWAFLRVIEYSN